MNNHIRQYAKKRYNTTPDNLPEREKRILEHYQERLPISRDRNIRYEEQLTFGQRLADKIASFGGSWTFILSFLIILVLWVVLNVVILAPHRAAFDPYPFILLNLFLSMLASIQAPIILMSQGRQAIRDRLEAEHDYEVNLKAELEIMGLHEKVDELRETKWTELIEMQQEQIRLLTDIVNRYENAGKK